MDDLRQPERQLSPLDRKRIEELRNELNDALVQVNWPYHTEQSWSSNFTQIKTRYPVEFVIGDAIDPEPFLSWESALRDLQIGARNHSLPIYGNSDDYIELVTPLVKKGPLAVVVDPYLNPLQEHYQDIILRLLVIAKGSCCHEIHLVARNRCKDGGRTKKQATSESWDVTEEELSSQFCDVYSPKLPKELKLALHLVNDSRKPGSLWMHNRYFFTRRGGFDFGLGVKIIGDSKKKQQPVHVIGSGLLSQLKDDYLNGIVLRDLRAASKITHPEVRVHSTVVGFPRW